MHLAGKAHACSWAALVDGQQRRTPAGERSTRRGGQRGFGPAPARLHPPFSPVAPPVALPPPASSPLAAPTLRFEALGRTHAALHLPPGALWDQDGRSRNAKVAGDVRGPRAHRLLRRRRCSAAEAVGEQRQRGRAGARGGCKSPPALRAQRAARAACSARQRPRPQTHPLLHRAAALPAGGRQGVPCTARAAHADGRVSCGKGQRLRQQSRGQSLDRTVPGIPSAMSVHIQNAWTAHLPAAQGGRQQQRPAGPESAPPPPGPSPA